MYEDMLWLVLLQVRTELLKEQENTLSFLENERLCRELSSEEVATLNGECCYLCNCSFGKDKELSEDDKQIKVREVKEETFTSFLTPYAYMPYKPSGAFICQGCVSDFKEFLNKSKELLKEEINPSEQRIDMLNKCFSF